MVERAEVAAFPFSALRAARLLQGFATSLHRGPVPTPASQHAQMRIDGRTRNVDIRQIQSGASSHVGRGHGFGYLRMQSTTLNLERHPTHELSLQPSTAVLFNDTNVTMLERPLAPAPNVRSRRAEPPDQPSAQDELSFASRVPDSDGH